ncbi:MAG: hypothetical protein U1D55_15645 [Phycisphaerae bacterium]
MADYCRELFWSLSLLLVLFSCYQMPGPAEPIWLRSEFAASALLLFLEADFLLCVLCFWTSGVGRIVYVSAMIVLGRYTLFMPLVMVAQAMRMK